MRRIVIGNEFLHRGSLWTWLAIRRSMSFIVRFGTPMPQPMPNKISPDFFKHRAGAAIVQHDGALFRKPEGDPGVVAGKEIAIVRGVLIGAGVCKGEALKRRIFAVIAWRLWPTGEMDTASTTAMGTKTNSLKHASGTPRGGAARVIHSADQGFTGWIFTAGLIPLRVAIPAA